MIDRLIQDITNLPADRATGSRDFGRGYAQAIRDVLELIAKREEVSA